MNSQPPAGLRAPQLHELGDLHERQDGSDEERDVTPSRVAEAARRGELHPPASVANPAAAAGQHVLHPLHVRPVDEGDDVALAVSKDG